MTTLVIRNMEGNYRTFRIPFNSGINDIMNCVHQIPRYREITRDRVSIYFRNQLGEFLEFQDNMRLENITQISTPLFGRAITNRLSNTTQYIELSIFKNHINLRLFDRYTLPSYDLDHEIYRDDLTIYYNYIQLEPQFIEQNMATIWTRIAHGEPEYTIIERRNNQPILRLSRVQEGVTTNECWERMQLIGL